MIVVDHLNNGFGPVFKRRSSRDSTMASMLIFFFAIFICSICYYTDGQLTDFGIINKSYGLPGLDMIGYFSALISALILGEFLRRLNLFSEEVFHIKGRYKGSFSKAFLACIHGKHGKTPHIFITGFISSIITVYYWSSEDSPKITKCMYICIAILSSLGMKYLGFTSLSKAEISELNEKQNSNVADGLAWSYYFGYLKFVLEGFAEIIEQSIGDKHKVGEDYMRDLITVKKLFIVISSTCDGYKEFNAVDNRIERLDNLHPIHKTRGGVLNRTYKNTLYRITLEGKEPIYVAMEYATPLLSMYDMQTEENRSQTNFTKEDLDEQVVEFYIKLKEILEHDKDCKNKYQIILCEDVMKSLPEIIYKSINDPTIDVC